MTVTDACFDYGNLCVRDDALDKTRAASGNEYVEVVFELHKLSGALTCGVLNESDAVLGEADGLDRRAHCVHDCAVGVDSLLAAAQDNGAACFETESRSVGGDVGTRLVDNADNAHGDGDLLDFQTVFEGSAVEDFADGIGKSRDLGNACRHALDSALVESETVEQ